MKVSFLAGIKDLYCIHSTLAGPSLGGVAIDAIDGIECVGME